MIRLAVRLRPILALIPLLFAVAGGLQAEPITGDRIRVIDGDTIKVDGASPNIRLVGFNAPETRRAKCDAERELAARRQGACETSSARARWISPT